MEAIIKIIVTSLIKYKRSEKFRGDQTSDLRIVFILALCPANREVATERKRRDRESQYNPKDWSSLNTADRIKTNKIGIKKERSRLLREKEESYN